MNTTTLPETNATKLMDVRPIPCSVKHGQILQRWHELPLGDHFVLLNDHDPVPLHYQSRRSSPGSSFGNIWNADRRRIG